jgi:dihydropyrimidine dehydrogenase (NAD+) subunit PreA
MASDPQLAGVPISGMGGIATWRDAAEFLALGCETVQITTAVMQYGYRIIDDLKDGLHRYLSDRGFRSVTEMIGKAVPNLVPAGQLDRDSILYPKFHPSECVGCGRCYISCFDGGHQAITMDPVQRRPKLNAKKCVGCHLCRLVCPVNAISAGPRIVSSKAVSGSISLSA